MLLYLNSVVEPMPPPAWAMLFRQEIEDVMKRAWRGEAVKSSGH
jgi:hypothetical protein